MRITKSHIRTLRMTFVVSIVLCTIVTIAIVILYERSDWAWELSLSNGLVIFLAAPTLWFIGRKVEHITALKEELQKLVERDRLTDVATRDFFFAQLDAAPDAYGVSLMVDIDHFKHVNDTFGHLSGDDVIQTVAKALKAQMRDDDIVCRFGGEEFVIFLKDATPEQGWTVAERIRKGTEAAITQSDLGPIKVTVSIGGSLKQEVELIEQAIHRADRCLYRAKDRGRNRTVVDWPSGGAAQSTEDEAKPFVPKRSTDDTDAMAV